MIRATCANGEARVELDAPTFDTPGEVILYGSRRGREWVEYELARAYGFNGHLLGYPGMVTPRDLVAALHGRSIRLGMINIEVTDEAGDLPELPEGAVS
jgi:hypothetical protein